MPESKDFFHTPDEKPTLVISTEAEACAAILMACLRANELDSHSDNATFYTTVKSRNIFKGQDTDQLIRSAAVFFEEAGQSPAALIDIALQSVREQTRLPLFYNCVDVILADGLVTPQEHRVIQYLRNKFRVSEEAVASALEVLVSKNQL